METEYYLLCDKEDSARVVQLSLTVRKRKSFSGITARTEWDGEGRKHWSYMENQIDATVFEGFSEAVDARFLYRIPQWIIPRPLSSVETSVHLAVINNRRQNTLEI